MASVYKRNGKGPWYAAWTDHTGSRKSKCTRTTDKATAERIAKKHEADAALRRDGVIDPTLDSISVESQRSVEDHLADFESKMLTAGRTLKHVQETKKYILEITKSTYVTSVASIRSDAVTKYATNLLDNGKSARTVQAYLTAIKSFTKWLAANQKLSHDPLLSVKKPNPNTARKRKRRMLLPEEWAYLLKIEKFKKDKYGLDVHSRLLLYRTAIETGYRANELKSLLVSNFDNAEISPSISCAAGITKNGKPAKQIISIELAADLRTSILGRVKHGPLFKMPHASNLARMLRYDLDQARKIWLEEAKNDPIEHAAREASDFLTDTNHKEESIDFHSLRHTCGAWHALKGSPPKVVQTIMRHQSITMTMDTYGHVFPGQEAQAVQILAPMLSKKPCRAKEPQEEPEQLQRILQRAGSETGQNSAIACDNDEESVQKASDRKTPKIRARSDAMRDDTMLCLPTAPLAQLAEQLTLNQ